ncbi:hypothetical protein O181_124767 [Austropuccinia psidii MF-1]|uniref:No apical meristem-associated C-terminal domain-containing protein n=1 Tax=Austropuccinia psidii MF-1 TaxID=1389203 RepID=A0A9Q3Q6S4_9BASI|nr:hypothetical protein [Austropuccinia psidii MF-1]
MNSWHILNEFLKGEEIVRYSNEWNPLTSKPQIKKIKGYHAKKGEESKQDGPVASTTSLKSTNFPKKGRITRKIIGGNHIPQVTESQNSKKDAMENVFNMARALMEFKEKEEQRMRQTHFTEK